MARFVRREYLVLVLISGLWGSGQTAGKLALRELHPGQLAVLRPACACLVLTILVLASGRGSRVFAELRASPRILAALGLLGYAGAGGSTVVALSMLPAGITSLLTATSPLMLVIGSLVLVRRSLRALQVAGAAVGFGGVVILGSGGLVAVGELRPLALLGVPLALGSAACWAGYTALARRVAGRDALVTTAISSGIGTALVAVVAVPREDWSTVAHASWPTLAAAAWAGGVAIGCAYLAWSLVLRRLPPASVLPFNYVTPIFGVGIASVVLGEAITPAVVVGAVCVIAGVSLSQLDDWRLLRQAKVHGLDAAGSVRGLRRDVHQSAEGNSPDELVRPSETA